MQCRPTLLWVLEFFWRAESKNKAKQLMEHCTAARLATSGLFPAVRRRTLQNKRARVWSYRKIFSKKKGNTLAKMYTQNILAVPYHFKCSSFEFSKASFLCLTCLWELQYMFSSLVVSGLSCCISQHICVRLSVNPPMS